MAGIFCNCEKILSVYILEESREFESILTSNQMEEWMLVFVLQI